MVKSANARLNKYSEKISDPKVIRKMEDAKKSMIKNFKSAAHHQREVNEIVNKIVAAKTIPSHHHFFYGSFGLQVDKSFRNKTGEGLRCDIDIAVRSWKMRGLDEKYLKKILTKIKKLNKL